MSEGVPVRILIIEDDPAIRRFLRIALDARGYRSIEATTGKDALLQAATQQAELIVLDLGLPDIDGVELTRQLRAWFKAPIIVVSARGKEQDKVAALDAGANDYVTKPFGIEELLARVRVALRHKAGAAGGADAVARFGDVTVDQAARRVTRGDKPVHLTPNEFRLLAILIEHSGKVLTHKFLLGEIWGPHSSGETHYLRVYMNQLRQKLENDPARPKFLRTEPGVGYRLEA